jgi:hypothetical protein
VRREGVRAEGREKGVEGEKRNENQRNIKIKNYKNKKDTIP